MKERWKPISGYEDFYEVSSIGRVRLIKERGPAKPKIMKQQCRNGYMRVPLTDNNGNRSYKSVHRLVANEFIGESSSKEINHKNGIKDDNRTENLEWCSRSENAQHAFDNDLQVPNRGSGVGGSKLTENDVLQIRSIYNQGWATYKELADAWNTTKQNICYIIKNKTWTHI